MSGALRASPHLPHSLLLMFKSRRFALLVGALIVGALGGWLGWGALNPQWGGEATETFLVRRARAGEWGFGYGGSKRALATPDARQRAGLV